jgi:hypothetical protein
VFARSLMPGWGLRLLGLPTLQQFQPLLVPLSDLYPGTFSPDRFQESLQFVGVTLDQRIVDQVSQFGCGVRAEGLILEGLAGLRPTMVPRDSFGFVSLGFFVAYHT